METPPVPFSSGFMEQTCFVYDRATGYVVHIHQFCPLEPGGRCAESEMENAALEHLPSDLSRGDFSVFHHTGELRLKSGHRYRVDVDRQVFVAEPQDPPEIDRGLKS